MREKSKKTVKTRLLALLLVFCMTFQMVSYSPGNVVRAEGEEEPVAAAEAAALADNTPLENKVYLLSMGAANPVINGELEAETAWPPFLSARLAIGAQSGGYTKESPNVAFKLDLALDDDYLGAVLEKHQSDSGFPNDPMESDYQQQLTDFFQKNETIQPVTLTLDLGDEFDASTFETINGAKENELQNSTGTKIGSYTVKKIDGQAKLVVTFEKLIYGFNSVKAGLSFQLGLQDSAFADNKPVDVEWDNDNAQINVFEWKDPNAPGPNDRDYEVGKRVVTEAQPNPDSNAPITEVETPYLDYEIKVSANPDNQEGADKQALTLADKIFEDMIPSGLQVSEVKLNGTKLEQAAYSIENGKLSYTFPNDSTAKTATFWIRLALSAENYKNFLVSNNFNQTFTNTASLHSLDSTMPVWTSDPVNADIKMTLISKDGQQLPEDGTKIQWTININTHFTNLGEAYLVDSISTNDQNYDLESGIKLTGINGAGNKTSWSINKNEVVNLEDTTTKYENLTIGDLKAIGKKIGKKKAGIYNYTDGSNKKAVLIIPYNAYTNQKVTVTYNTNINTEDNLPNTGDKDLTNEAKLLWDTTSYPGIGPGWHPDNWIEIDKPAPVVASLVSKKGGDYDEDSHIMNWSFTTNRYNVDINDLTITDVFTDSQQLLLENSLTYSKNGGETKPLTKDTSTNQPYYEVKEDSVAGTATLVIHCPATIPKNDYYTFNLQSEVTDPAFLADQAKATLTNEAAIKAKVNGKEINEAINAKKEVVNTLIEKSVKTPYNYNSHQITWDVTINPHHVPLSEAVVTDNLPVGNTFVSLDNVKRINDQGDTVEDIKVPSGAATIGLKNGINLSWIAGTDTKTPEGYAQNQEIFTFNNNNDIDTYVLTLTTEVSDDLYRQAIFSTNDEIQFKNEVILSGKVLGVEIKDAHASAPAPAKSTVVDKSYEYDKANGLVTWTVVMNTNGVDMDQAKLEEKLNPVFEMDTDKANFHFYNIQLNDNGSFTEAGEITENAALTTLKDAITPLAADGFTFTMPNTYKNQAIALTFQTYILDDIKSGEVTNTVTFGKNNGGDADKNPHGDATFDENFNIDDYAQIAPAPLIMVKKESSNGPIPLENATFTMDRYTATTADTYIKDTTAKIKTYNTRDTGKATFLNIKKDYVYKLVETKAPEGYAEIFTPDANEIHYFMFVKKNPIVTFFTGAGITQKEMTVDGNKVTVDLIPTTFNSYTYTQTNDPTGKLEFTKNGADSSALKGAEFTLTRDDGQWTDNDRQKTSDDLGKVIFDKLDPGTYTLKETKAPDLYTELTGTLKVNVDAAGATTITKDGGEAGTIQDALTDTSGSYTISNGYVSGSIKVHKVDEEKDTIKLAGAEFELHKGVSTGEKVGDTQKTGSNGIAEFKNVPYDPAGYTVVETKAPDGYLLPNPASKVISGNELKSKIGNNKDYTYEVSNVANKRIRKDISLTKKNNKNEAETLKDINFQLVYYYDKNNNDQYKPGTNPSITTKDLADGRGWYIEGTTDNNGVLTFSNIPYGHYTLEEVSNTNTKNYKPVTIDIPRSSFTDTANSSGIKLSTTGKDYVENALKTVDFNILKTDNVGDNLSNVEFTLSGKNTYDEDFTQGKTTQNGIAAFTGIPISKTYYTLTETTTNTDGYAAAKEYRVNVTGNETDGSAKVEIKPVENNIEGTALTLENGNYNIQNTPVLGTISFTKKDSEGRTLVGVPFKLERQIDGKDTSQDDDQPLTNKTFYNVSDSSGVVTFSNVPYANYTLTEVDKDGKTVSGVQSFTPKNIYKADLEVTSSGSGETFTWKTTEVTNTLNKASITLTKQDQAGAPLKDVTFTVKRMADNAKDNQKDSFVLNPAETDYFDYYDSADPSKVVTATSDADGKLTINDLVYGKYKLEETQEPENPASGVDAPEITFTVDANGQIQGLTGTSDNNIITNTIKYGYVNLLKQTDDKENLPGVKFGIFKTDVDGNAIGDAIRTLTTDANGKLDKGEMQENGVGLLTYGSYVLKETSVNGAFTMSAESYKFTIGDATTGEEGTAWISPGSNADNVIYKKANEGDPSANDLKPIINTAKRQPIELTKTGADGAALSDAVFAVYDGNTLVAELKESTSVSGTYNTLKTTDLNSEITDSVTEKKTITVSSANITIPYIKDNKLLAGTYTIKEMKQPGGYVLPDAGKSVTITVDNGADAATETLTNTQTSFSVEKLSNEVVTGDSKVLSDASLKICKDNNGEPSEDTGFSSWISGDTPYAVTGLPAGTYWLLETAAPDGYQVAAPIQFTLSNDNKLYSGDKAEGTPLTDNKLTMTDIRVYGQAKLTKTVTGATETLSGVPFKLYKRAGVTPNPETDKLIAENLTTGADGVIDTTKLSSVTNDETEKALSAGLWTGHYYFLEQTSDSLYFDTAKNLVEFEIKPENHYTAEKNNPVSVDMSNDKFKTDILFTKYDTTEVKGIAGVSFTLKRSSSHNGNYDETVNADIKTGADGTATLSLDKKGQYKLEETVTPTGYDSATKFVGTFEITDDNYNKPVDLNQKANWTSVTDESFTDGIGIANDRLPGSMTITKVDASNNTKLNGAAFTLYQVAEDKNETAVLNGVTGNTYTYTADNPDPASEETNEEGKLIITSLPWGQYKLVETTPPDGYIISSEPLEFDIKADHLEYGAVEEAATIGNTQSTFTLNKADATGDKFVNGAAFQLTDDSDNNKVIWATPDNTTSASTWSNITGKLVAGKTYTLTETKAPAGYEKAAAVKIKMDNTGVIMVTEGGDHASVTNKSTVTVKDQPIEIGLEKIDAESNEKLEGAVFKVTGTFADKAITEIEDTPANLTETLSGQLIAGETYTLTETTAPKGYELAEPINFIVDDAGKIALKDSPTHAALDNNNETIVLKNAQSEIFIQKTDADGKAIGGGAEFSLTGAFADGETVKTIKTEGNQPYSLKGLLSAGQTYVLSETRAADGYKLETRPVEITMSTAGTISVVAGTDKSLAEVTIDGLTLNFKDQPITLSLQKTDVNNENKPLKGAKFELTGDLADGSKTYIIDLTEKDRLGISALLIASTGTEKHEYTLTETTAPEGYQLQQTPVKFTVDKDGKVTITNIDAVKGFAALSEDKLSLSFANTLKQGDITFTKYGTNDENDLNAKEKLSGAVFGLYTDAETKIPVKDATDKAVTATSGEDGNVTFKDIYVGSYYVKEITAPEDYTADSTIYQAVIDNKGNCDGLHTVAGIEVSNNALSEITNQAVRGKISIAKTDSFDGKAIEGIEFALTKKDKAGKDITVKTGKTDKDGKLVFSNLLMDTEYRIYETETLSGYVLSTVAQNITLKTDETEKAVAFTNAPTELTFKKVDTTGGGLSGAEFTLYDGGAEVAKALSDKDGMVTFLYLEKGKTYILKETKRPGDDYLLSTTEFKAVVDKDGTCTLKNNDETVTEVVNADAGVITLNKTGEDSKPLAGTTFELKNDAGEVIQTQITGADGKLVFADVPMGSYTVVETAAPDPYAVSEDVTKVTLSRGASQKVSVSRVNTLSQVVFHKRGIITEGCAGDLQHAPLEGAVYGLYEDPECATEPTYTATSGNPADGCKVIFTGVARGTWYVKEITAPQHYMLDTTVYKAVVDGNGHFDGLANLDDTKVADNRVVDAAVTTDIVLKKVNEQKPDEVLPGSTYGLFKKAAKASPAQARSFSFFGTESAAETEYESEWQQIAEATTDQDGYLRFEGVLMGVEYSIRELKAPEGSHVSEKPVNIKFGINEAGEPVIESIDLGLADPSDPNSPPTATVDPETGEIVWLEPSIVAEISKTDMNANLLAGARLRISVKDGSGVYIPLTQADGQPAEWVSGEQPETFVKLMKIGKDYRLEEIEAPSGYKLAAPVDFTVRTPEQGVGPGENLTEQVVLKNELTSFFISKTTINGTDELPGAVLAVYETAGDGSIARDEDGNEIVAKTITGENLSWTSGKEMKKIEGLPAGTYVLREITAPDGYEVAEEITFTLMPDGTVAVGGKTCEGNIVRMQDKPAAETGTPDVPDKPQTSSSDHPDANNGAATGIAGSVSPATFWGVLALLSVAALLVCSIVVWRRKRW
ncbi:SpaA isopeptide-forming pilin-related protein [Eubacterium limosum]|uniref:SpaA isopeptide-forming pilin-related protein n=1 Tax=Eubacterium limosum TaxID=1736 RepID=UPI003714351F